MVCISLWPISALLDLGRFLAVLSPLSPSRFLVHFVSLDTLRAEASPSKIFAEITKFSSAFCLAACSSSALRFEAAAACSASCLAKASSSKS